MDESLLTFASGIHPRLGEESPIQIIGPQVVQWIAEYTIEEIEESFRLMIKDHLNRSTPQLHEIMLMKPETPMNYDRCLREIRNTYHHPVPRLCQERLMAYQRGSPKSFLSKAAAVVNCLSCGATWYRDIYPFVDPPCPKCPIGQTRTWPIKILDIPPWIDITLHYWESFPIFNPVTDLDDQEPD